MDNPKKDAIDSILEDWDQKHQSTRRRSLMDWYDQIDQGHWESFRKAKNGGAILPGSERIDDLRLGPPNVSLRGSQITTSETHPDWNRYRNSGTFHGDLGGPFFSQSKWVRADFPHSQIASGIYDTQDGYLTVAKYRGPILAQSPTIVAFPGGTLRNLGPLGTTAIARCRPTNHVADLSTFIAELLNEGLPKKFGASLWEDRISAARNSGDEYLNYEFGWAPLLADVNSILYSLSHASTLLRQYEHGSGTMTRRKYEFPLEKTLSYSSYVSDAVIASPQSLTPLTDKTKARSPKQKESRTWRRTWFSGAFTYHLPSGYHSRNAIVSLGAKAEALLGSSLDPETLWNAGPWSWAVDWFSNAGDVISNLSSWATDGLVLKYGYIMEHSVYVDRYYAVGPHNLQSRGVYESPLTVGVETKRREAATPYGFEAKWSNLTPRQLAITAALGLTRRWR